MVVLLEITSIFLVRVVAAEMGDPVVCTLVLVRDISLSLSIFLSLSLSLWSFILGQLWFLPRTEPMLTPLLVPTVYKYI